MQRPFYRWRSRRPICTIPCAMARQNLSSDPRKATLASAQDKQRPAMEICSMFGRDSPLIVRRTSGERYHIVDDICVRGMMDGERIFGPGPEGYQGAQSETFHLTYQNRAEGMIMTGPDPQCERLTKGGLAPCLRARCWRHINLCGLNNGQIGKRRNKAQKSTNLFRSEMFR